MCTLRVCKSAPSEVCKCTPQKASRETKGVHYTPLGLRNCQPRARCATMHLGVGVCGVHTYTP